jgi:hypothetical protein
VQDAPQGVEFGRRRVYDLLNVIQNAFQGILF